MPTLEDQYTSWIYLNYPIGNGHMLVEVMENMTNWDYFLKDMGLPLTTEMEF